MKKIISSIMALSVIGSMMITPTFAELDIIWDEDGWGYQLIDENTAKIMKYQDNNVLEIPEEIDGYKIVDFHSLLFMDSNYKSCDLSAFPTLGAFMFTNSLLENVKLSEELKILPGAVFYNTKIKNINLPEGLEVIEADAMASCENLEEIVIPSTVTRIDSGAFANCPNLWKVTFIDGIKKIGMENKIESAKSVFAEHNIKVAIIPESVEHIEHREFRKATEINGEWAYGEYPEDFVIYAKKGSYAEDFAKENDIKYQALISVNVNDKEIEFDQPPVVENNRTLVPMRAIFEALGAEVEWNESLKAVKATKDDITIIFTVGKDTMYKNGEAITLEAAPQIVNSRTLVPVRAIAESFGNEVSWDAEELRVDVK